MDDFVTSVEKEAMEDARFILPTGVRCLQTHPCAEQDLKKMVLMADGKKKENCFPKLM